MSAAFKSETAFLRGCAKTYETEVGFSPQAEADMAADGITWPDVYQVLRSGRVVWSDKEEACGARSIMVGRTCEGEKLSLTVEWDYPSQRVRVTRVERL